MELKSNKSSRTRDSGKSWSTTNWAMKSKETSSDKVSRDAFSKSQEDLTTMDSPWNKESSLRTRRNSSWLQEALDTDAREREFIWESPSEDVSSETRSPLLTSSSCPEVRKRSPDSLMSRKTTDLVQREPTRSESSSVFQSTPTTSVPRTRPKSRSPTLTSNRLSLRESLKRSMERSTIKLQESPDFWPTRDSEERESRSTPKSPPLRETKLFLLTIESLLRRRGPRTNTNIIFIIFFILKE